MQSRTEKRPMIMLAVFAGLGLLMALCCCGLTVLAFIAPDAVAALSPAN